MVSHRDFVMREFDTFLKEYAVEKGRLLDVGARDACLKDSFEQRGFSYSGIDKFPRHQDVLPALMEGLPTEFSNTFAVVFVCHTFEHGERPIDALREFKRVLRPGGWLFIAGPPPCEHHILKADEDHLFVLDEMQMKRLLMYTGYNEVKTWRGNGNVEQNDTIVAVGKKS